MKILGKFPAALIVAATLAATLWSAVQPSQVEQRAAAAKHLKDGNFRDALAIYRKLALDADANPALVGKDLEAGINCLARLGRIAETDAFRDAVVERHAGNWRLLATAVKTLADGPHYGFLVAGEFQRGNRRGGGRYVGSLQRDRAQALALLEQARPLADNDPDKPGRARFYIDWARILMLGRGGGESWRLTGLTDTRVLPDYNEMNRFRGSRGYGGATRGAPVDADGNPVFHRIPETYQAASSDGQRWRWALGRAVASHGNVKPEVLLVRGRFLHGQFGVQTMRPIITPRREAAGDGKPKDSGPWAVDTLADTETIARLASGIKRFELPDEFNFIGIFRQLARGPRSSFAEAAADSLPGVFSNRQQYLQAAAAWRAAIEKFGPGRNNRRRNQLNQIVGNWVRFETMVVQPAGRGATVDFRFRNGKHIDFEAHRVNVEQLLKDVQAYLESGPARVDYRQVNIGDIGGRLVRENQRKYLGARVAGWDMDLKPRTAHLDRRVTVTTPLQDPGVYLLVARMAGGNTSRILVWVTDTVIAHKTVAGRDLYFVADAVSGRPLAGVRTEFFGYRSIRLAPNRFAVQVRRFVEQTDQDGLVSVDAIRKLGADRNNGRYQWLVTARSDGGRMAHLGFNRLFFGRVSDAVYDQSRVYVITDRPVYRPGHAVKFKFWIRNSRYDKPNESLYANRSVTIKVTGPRNKSLLEKEYTTDAFGGFDGEVPLADDVDLGNYRIAIVPNKSDLKAVTGRNVGGGGTFRVEEYKKPEYEVTVEAPEKPVALGEPITATIRARYYFGAPVTHATVKYRVFRETHSEPWFPVGRWDWLYGTGYWWYAAEYSWYPDWRGWGCMPPRPPWFGVQRDPPELVMENTVPVGDDGTVAVTIDTSLAKRLHGDRDHRYRITAEVVDASRRTIVGTGSVLAARKPFKVFAWVDRGFYRIGDTIRASFQARTLDGKPVTGKGKLTLFRVTYDEKARPVETEVETWDLATGVDGKATQQIKAGAAGQYRLSYRVTDGDDHTIEGGYLFIVRGPGFDGAGFRFNDIELVTDQREYKPGDVVKLMVNTNRTGSTVLLITRASSGSRGRHHVLRLKGKSLVVTLPITAADMPNIHVEAITIAGGKLHTAVRELVVPPAKRVVNVTVEPSQETYRPGQPAKLDLTLTDSQGRPWAGSLVLTMYDKSVEYISGGSNIGAIREFFWKYRRYFYPRTSSNLQRNFGNLLKPREIGMANLGTFGHLVAEGDKIRRMKAMSRGGVGGGGGGGGMRMAEAADGAVAAAPDLVQPTVRTKFADTALWAGSVTAGADGKAQLELDMPENLTTWKVRAWAMGHGTNVGEGTVEVITTKNLLVRLQAPRFFTETDEVVLSANVHNYLEEDKRVVVRLELDGGTLEAIGPTERSTMIPAGGEARIDWKVKVVKPGEAVVRMAALTDEESDAIELAFPVHVHGMLKTDSFTGVIRPDQASGAFDITVPLKRRINQTRLEIRYSPTLAGALVDALPYLVEYPYSCTEQTLNRFLPTLITHNLLKSMNIDLEAVRRNRTNLNPQEIGDDAERAKQWKRYDRNPVFDSAEVTRMVAAGVKALADMQLADGGWGWFSGFGERSSAHTTAIVVHGLLVARENKVTVDDRVVRRGVDWLERHRDEQLRRLKNAKRKKKPWKAHADNIDALVFGVLVEADEEKDAMEDFLYRDRTHLSVYAKGLFGLALEKLNRRERLAMIIRNIDQFLVQDDENQSAWLRLPNGSPWWYWYGSETEANAVYLKLLARTDPKGTRAPRLVKYLLNNRRHASYWNSTRDTGLCIEAMAEYLVASGEDRPDLEIDVVVDGRVRKTVRVNSENLFSFDNKLVMIGDAVESGKHRIELRKRGRGPLYFNGYLTNFTTEDHITKAGLEIKVSRRYFRLVPKDKGVKVADSSGQSRDQKVLKYNRVPIANLAEVTSGDLLEIELVVDSKNDYEYLVFEDPKAAGFEPADLRSGYVGGFPRAYRELRDDRVAFFVRSLARGRHSFAYRVRAEIPGRYSALPTRASAMYAPELKANSDEIKLVIRDRPKPEPAGSGGSGSP